MALFGEPVAHIILVFPPLPEVKDDRDPQLIREAIERRGRG